MAFDAASWIKTHPKPAAIGAGATGVVGLALYRKKKAAAATSTTPTTTSSSAGSTVPGGTTGGVAYDSSADDVYNSVEGVLEQLQGTITQLGTAASAAQANQVSTQPTDATTAAAADTTGAATAAAASIIGTPPATTGDETAAQITANSFHNSTVATPAGTAPNTATVAGNYINWTYIGDDGKTYTESVPNTAGNQIAIQKQGGKVS
jgi:hypothetical protein